MSSNSIPATSSQAEEEMEEVKLEECCLENKQSTAASSSSLSEGSGSAILKSPGVCSPASTSPTPRRTSGPIRRAKGGWTPQEDETLRNAVAAFKGKSWKKIAEYFPDRSEVQCLHRWQKEDDKIIELVAKYGPTKWSLIAKSLPGRIGKQCRESSQNGAKETSKSTATKRLLVCSTKGSDSTAQTSSGNADVCKLDEDGKDQLESSAPYQDLGASSSVLPNEPADSEGVECQLRSSFRDLSCCNSESGSKFENFAVNSEPQIESIINSQAESENCGFNNLIDEDRVKRTPVPVETPGYGSLYYEPPLESCGPFDSGFSSMRCFQHDYASSPNVSPISFYTPPCVKGSGLCNRSPESILKMAAKTFPNTPSILRKRKNTSQGHLPPNKIGLVDCESVREVLNVSDEQERHKNSAEMSGSQEESLCESPTSQGISTIGPNGKAFNASPPYRLRARRNAIFKSVEKQLEFTCDKEYDGNSKSVELSANGGSGVIKDCSHATKMEVT
ncbi:transcription factor MYB3R-3 [Prunus yedoensis var. nudiflora]|uniref:Transcription factor MYB3R-3 n=1 Tax=Prunus yedoensis var. nudiflora TaxID=2094558 RepID=A0A314YTF3_PRUYE|nr:transcription factor MYB3R-3 [Prunus yedoensis var. nudiflora]